ncbi:membrane protein [Intrasporangium chromatireducens]|uniref:membrane protein n=1 Tax=Intrasporangium chromatireducens TaxID=1386088 RepID=UPI0004B33FD7|nr:membrane protein [Intrasporangium chromatireducens]
MTPGSEPSGIPQRVRVTSPRTSAARARRVSIASEIDAQTQLGEVYVTSLIRSQLRLALGVAVALAVTLGGLPVVFTLVPAFRRATVLGVPLPWILLTVVAFAEIIALGWAYVRRAERNEDDFSDLLEGR